MTSRQNIQLVALPLTAGPPAEPSGQHADGLTFALVSMPWHALGAAPLSLATLRSRLARTHPGVQVTEHYLNIEWAEHLLRESGGAITPPDYHDVADRGISRGLGDWVFAGALYDNPGWKLGAITQSPPDWDPDGTLLRAMRGLAGGFVEAAAEELARLAPDVIGFSSTFMQNVPSLALARRIKMLRPGTRIIFGGANCDGPMGAALHRNHPFVDFVVRGEAELVLPQLIDRIARQAGAASLDGVCWWNEGTSVANPQLHPAVPADQFPAAAYDTWHEAFTQSPVAEYTAPYLVVEGSRGCWWGERHHCTFCGLNDATIGFRGKAPAELLAELTGLVRRHQILDIITSDNIMSFAFFRELLPLLAAENWDLRIHYEMKANIKREQIALLARAGLSMIQIGIESLSTRVLALMNKGVNAATCVRVLRDCQDEGVSVAWNWLYGFPGETASDYPPVIRQLPALVHLEPPGQGDGSRIALDRFSPYFEKPELGFPARRPADFYTGIYNLPTAELADLAYYFDCDPAGIGGDTEDALNQALATWAAGFERSYLYTDATCGDALIVFDERAGWPRRTVELPGWQKTAYQELQRGQSASRLHSRLADSPASQGIPIPGEDVLAEWLASLLEQGLVFSDGPRWVALATDRVNPKLPKVSGT